jgi:hypothetical protein
LKDDKKKKSEAEEKSEEEEDEDEHFDDWHGVRRPGENGDGKK